MAVYAALHAPIIPVLRLLLADAALKPGDVALDLACGAGEKLPLLRDAIGPQALLLALDIDQDALTMLPADIRAMPIQADAQAIPLRDGCCALVMCIAALGLFAHPQAALREIRRVLHTTGRGLMITSRQAWAQVTHWPPELLVALDAAYSSGLPLPAHADILENALEPFFAAGFTACTARAFLLSPATAHAELALLPWSYLAPQLHHALTAEQRSACAAAPVEIELCTLALAVTLANQ